MTKQRKHGLGYDQAVAYDTISTALSTLKVMQDELVAGRVTAADVLFYLENLADALNGDLVT